MDQSRLPYASPTYTWAQSASNKEIDFAAEEFVVLPIEDIARSLANICRHNGHCNPYYSVAEHSINVSHLVAPELALAALMHDASEAYVGDLCTGLKRALGPAFKQLEHKAAAAVAKGFGIAVEDLDHPTIKAAEKRLLADEKIIMPHHIFWDQFNEPTGRPIHGWSPETARQKFLERFEELTNTMAQAA